MTDNAPNIAFSDLAKEAFARHLLLARKSKHVLEPEHLLSALVELKSGSAWSIFEKANIHPAEIKDRVELDLKPVQENAIGAHSDRHWKFMKALEARGGELGSGDLLHAVVRFLEKESKPSPMLIPS